jgi:polyisoprenoid-binding protein YceI
MRNRISTRSFLAWTLATVIAIAATATLFARQDHALALASGKVTVAGSSNIHEWSATTSDVRITSAKLTVGLSDPNFVDAITKPGALAQFDISIPVATLKSGKDGLDKNMYKALKSPEIANITFRATKMAAGTTAGMLRATGFLKIAGVEKEISFDVKTQLTGAMLTIKGTVPLLMTDFGVEPPKAMMGMLKTDPKITVTFEATLAVPPAATFHN